MKKVYIVLLSCMLFGTVNAQNNALNFDGINDRVNIPNSASVQIPIGTMEAWIQIPVAGAGASFRGIFVKEFAYGMFLIGNQFSVFDWTAGPTTPAGPALNDNLWHHVAFSFQSGVAGGSQMYLDGAPFGGPFLYTISNQTTFPAIGASSTAPGQNLNGTIDETRLWNTVRTAPQIIADMNSPLNGDEAGLVAYYRYNQGVACGNNTGVTTLLDGAPGGGVQNGTLVGFALVPGCVSNWVGGVPGAAFNPGFRVHNVTKGTDYPTYAAAIAAAITTNGDDILGDAGTFDEPNPVIIDKELQIRGTSTATTIVRPANNTIGTCGRVESTVFSVRANNVHIHHLTIDGNGTPISGLTSNGVNVDAWTGISTHWPSGDFTNLEVNNTLVKNLWQTGIYSVSDVGINTFNFHNNTVDNVNGGVAGCDQSTPIGIYNYGNTGSITNNIVTNCSDAIHTNYGSATTITGNNVTGIAGGAGTSGVGISSDNNGGGASHVPDQITNNVIDMNVGLGSSNGISIFQPYVNVNVDNNSIINYTSIGVKIAGRAPATLAKPTITNNDIFGAGGSATTGVCLTSVQQLVITGPQDVAATVNNNNVTGNTTEGFRLESVAGHVITLTAHFNNIDNPVENARVVPGGDVSPTDMTCNWWGSNVPGNVTGKITGLNPPQYIPYLTSGTDISANRGFQTTESCNAPCNTSAGGPYGPVCRDANPIPLTGTPAGGTFSGGPGGAITGAVGSQVFNPSVSGPGVFVIVYTLPVANGCPPGTTTVTVNPKPSAAIVGATNSTICAGQSSNVDITTTAGTAPFNGHFNIAVLSGAGIATADHPFGPQAFGASAVLIPPGELTNTSSVNTIYRVTWISLTDVNGCTAVAPSPNLTGSVDITVEPVPNILAVPDFTTICFNGTVNITVTNPNGVGGTYTRTGSYPGGVNHTALTPPQANQAYGVFTDKLTNTTGVPQIVTYIFTPDGSGTLSCPGTPDTIHITALPTPTITCPGAQTKNTDPGVCTYATVGTQFDPTSFTPNVSCNGGSPTITYTSVANPGAGGPGGVSPASGGNSLAGAIFNHGQTTITWRVTDGIGNSTTCSFTVTVTDNVAPTITCPVTGNANRNTTPGLFCFYTVLGTEFNATASDNCSVSSLSYVLTGVTTGSGTSLAGVNLNKGITTVTWTAIDGGGSNNTSTCNFTVTVTDNQAPTVTCPGPPSVIADTFPGNPGFCYYSVLGTEFNATAVDNCSVSSLSYVLTGVTTGSGTSLAGVHLNKGITTVTWTAIDVNSNTSSCNFTVTVKDNEVPTLTCPVNQVKNTDPGVCTWTNNVNLNPANSDNCPGQTISYTSVATPGPGAPGGVTPASGTTLNAAGVFNKGLTTIIWLVTDASGNTNTCSFTVTVNDLQPPVLTCPGQPNFQVFTDPGVCTFTKHGLDWNGSAIENCGVVVLQYTSAPQAGNGPGGVTPAFGSSLDNAVFNKGVTKIIWTATDESGNSSTCNYLVTVTDNVPPTLTCPGSPAVIAGNATRNTNGGLCTWVSPDNSLNATATDNCSVTVTYALTGVTPGTGTTLNGKIFNKGITTVTWLANDGSTPTQTCSFTVTVLDNQAPTVTCPVVGNANRNTFPGNPGVCYYSVLGTEFNATAVDNCGVSSLSYTLTGVTTGSGTSLANVHLNKGITTVTWTAIDAGGNTNTSSCSFTVTVNDNQAPTGTNPIATQTLNAGAGTNCTVLMPDYRALANAFDNCGIVTVTQQPPNGIGTTVIGYGGTRTVVLLMTDPAGNKDSVSFTLNIVDATPPTASCRNTTVVLDATGNTSLSDSAMTRLMNNGSMDNCGLVTLLASRLSFNCADAAVPGGVPVTLTVTDPSGNTATCQSFVTVLDKTPPVVTLCRGDTTIAKSSTLPPAIDACTNTLPDLRFRATFTDACSTTVTTTQSPAAGTIVAASIPSVLMTITGTDPSGNTNTCTFTVFLKDLTPPVISGCPGTVNVNTGAGNTQCSHTASWTPPTATDNCIALGPVTVTSNFAPGATFPGGTTAVIYTFTDAAGNTSVCTFNVVVTDNTAPTITCPAPINAPTGAGNTLCSVSVGTSNPTIFDNCGVTTLTWAMTGATIASSPATGINNVGTRVFNKGTTVVTYTVKDAAGNSSNCSFNVVVSDNTVPTITCPVPISVNTNTVNCMASVVTPNPTAFDNCGVTTLTWVMTGATTGAGNNNVGTTNFNVGVTTVTYTVTDGAGNSSNCSFTVTVINNLAGSICCNALVAQNGSTTSTITFTGSGGTVPYTFKYNLYINGVPAGSNPFTVTTVASNPSTTVAQSNAVTGVFKYALLSITDANGCTGTIPTGPADTATITVVAGLPDFTPLVDIGSLSFLPTAVGVNRDFIVNIVEIHNFPSTGPPYVQYKIPVLSAFTITWDPTATTANPFGPPAPAVAVQNSDWDITSDGSFITVTLKSTAPPIPPNGVRKVGFQIKRNVGIGANTTQNLLVTIVNGSGGDGDNSNNNKNTSITAQ